MAVQTTNSNNITTFNKLTSCRTCLQQIEIQNIHKYPVADNGIKEMLTACTKIHELNNEYPDGICSKCYDELVVAFNFKSRAEWCEEQLEKMLAIQQTTGTTNNPEESSLNTLFVVPRNEVWVDGGSSSLMFKKENFIVETAESLILDEVSSKENDVLETGTLGQVSVVSLEFSKTNHESNIHPLPFTLSPDKIKEERDTDSCCDTTLEEEQISEDLVKKEIDFDAAMDVSLNEEVKEDSTINTSKEPYVSPKHNSNKRNMRSSTKPKQVSNALQCDICFKTFTDKKRWDKHRDWHMVNYDRSCEYCSQKFGTKALLNAHIKHYHYVKESSSKTNAKNKDSSITESVIKENSNVQNSAETSGKTESLNSTTEQPPFKCELCSEVLPDKITADIHREKHIASFAFSCEPCGQRFLTRAELNAHIQQKHIARSKCRPENKEERPYACHLCPNRFKEKFTLLQHQKVHTKERPFLCSICGIGCRTDWFLKIHTRKHTKENPYVCEVETCKKGFRCLNYLKNHMRTHNGDRRFECTVCHHKSYSQADLNKHAAIHSDEKPFACEMCPFKTKHASSLCAHMKRIHKMKNFSLK